MKILRLWLYSSLMLGCLVSCQKEATTPDVAPVDDPATPVVANVAADKALLDKVQLSTIGYFWEYAHPASGMARERTGSGDVVTTGGTGFGVQAILVGVSRGWIDRAAAIEQLNNLCDFLATADRFHGAWPHWLNGSSGKVIPFSAKDDGGDLVETSYLINGLLAARAYFSGTGAEAELRDKITNLWEAVEWDWYASRGEGLLYWHWSPNNGWEMNMPIRGWNEALITYVLALASPTHAISPEVYRQTWVATSFGSPMNYGGYTLWMGPTYGGPLFFAQYSFLSLDPKQMEDTYANYWLQNVDHTMANRSYCLNNAPEIYGYAENYWGLTASDDPKGYSAHAPGNDNGTVAPTAALSSFPYTPYYSMQVLRNFYGSLQSILIGPYGLQDAHNKAQNWVAKDQLAIDQGPIVAMIENYRSRLLWRLFTDQPEIQAGLAKMDIHPPDYANGFPLAVPDIQKGQVDLLKHPDLNAYTLDVATKGESSYTLYLQREDGSTAEAIWDKQVQPDGLQQVIFGKEASTGKYSLHLVSPTSSKEVTVYLH
ncbi:glucoamylase family protein [Pontibacter chitinilyticus]|uniref:glucoamylase family protein n=1 Tax=Pontibacter chitinilyticus TaxID=2674989 RepID=UPI00321C2AB2